MKAVQEWLGYATYNITADYYSHLDFKSKMASADTISKLLDGSKQNGDTENDNSDNNPETGTKRREMPYDTVD